MTRALAFALMLASAVALPSVASATGASAAAPPTVAVLPFRDLSGGRGRVGEAIRETVTVDLQAVAGLRVLERAQIDRVLREQDAALARADADAIASVRLGTLLGASLVVAGAYQKSGPRVRLTARFVKVETGEVVGTAKIDGDATDLLALEDRVTEALVRSAGLDPRKALAARRPRPKLRSWKTIELYGDAAVEPDEPKRARLLQAALAEDPDFAYAARDLEALQARMAGYARASAVELAERERALLARAQDTKRPPRERIAQVGELFDTMAGARRFHALAQVAATLVESPLGDGVREPAQYRVFEALDRTRQLDRALSAGERYLARFPTGPRFREVEARMHAIVEARKKREARRAEYAADLADKLRSASGAVERDWAPCIAARWNNQINELMLDGCKAYLARHEHDADPDAREHARAARYFMVLALAESGDFAHARPLAEKVLAESNDWDEELRKQIAEWPTD
jgi:TolB-like protein